MARTSTPGAILLECKAFHWSAKPPSSTSERLLSFVPAVHLRLAPTPPVSYHSLSKLKLNPFTIFHPSKARTDATVTPSCAVTANHKFCLQGIQGLLHRSITVVRSGVFFCQSAQVVLTELQPQGPLRRLRSPSLRDEQKSQCRQVTSISAVKK